MVTVLMMSLKMATPGLLKINVFWNIDYDVTEKCLSRDSNYVVDVVMWSKFGHSSISVREVTTISFIRIWQKKGVVFVHVQ